eukprot:402538_1
MAVGHKQVPNDLDVSSFFAESVMNVHASNSGYNFYRQDGSPVPAIKSATQLLETVLSEGGDTHPFARHLYIHITEPSKSGFGKESAGRAYEVAEKLFEQFKHTQAQHLQHRPGHTFLRTGADHDSVLANIAATASDATFLNNGVIPYAPAHNMAFLIYAACMSGESTMAIGHTTNLRENYEKAPDRRDGPGPDQGWHIWRTTRMRFSKWSEVLEDSDLMPRVWPYQLVLGHYAKGFAYLRHNS